MASDQLPEGWRLVKLSDLGEVNRGRSRHRPRYAEHLYGGPYPFIQTGDVKNSGGRISSYEQTYSEAGLAQSRLWPAGTMCITIAANIAETAILTFPACFPDSVVGFIADESKCDVRYIEYTFRVLRARLQHEASGSVQDNINLDTLERLRFKLPSLAEQREVVYILSALDDKIELNLRMNETLEAMARALFKSWFVDFDPVRAKAEGRSFVLPQEIARYVPETFEETELGLVPNGWCVVSVGELCSRVAMGPFGSDIKTDNFVEAGVPVVRGSNLVDGFVEEAFVFLTEQKADELRNANAFPGNIVITHRGTLGQVGLIPIGSRFPRYVVSQSQMLLAVDMAVATPRYLYEFLRSAFGQHSLLANTSQTGVPAIARPTTSVKAIRIVKPPIEVLRGFDKVVDPLYTRRDHCVSESRTLANLRDTLLPKLISGALRVKAAEKIVEAVA
ncbi:restriction endonuclease subunit S [Bradyrhizobium oligotrophicum]|uniref:restriction endonuclease subunit S n=1 Tax=Bradyrhizobium oligotrophicum TaxID=44255 RepID=UPI003EBBA36E